MNTDFYPRFGCFSQSADLGQSKDPDGAARVLKCLHLGSATAFHQPRSAYGKSAEFWGFQRTKTKPLAVPLLIDDIGYHVYHRRLYYLIDWGVWQLVWQPNNILFETVQDDNLFFGDHSPLSRNCFCFGNCPVIDQSVINNDTSQHRGLRLGIKDHYGPLFSFCQSQIRDQFQNWSGCF